MSGADLGTWHVLCYLNLHNNLTEKYYYYPTFIEEETEADSKYSLMAL